MNVEIATNHHVIPNGAEGPVMDLTSYAAIPAVDGTAYPPPLDAIR